MARIHFLFTSALMLSAAVAAPINTNHGKVDTSAPSKHHSEPMRMTDAVMSSVPVMSIDAQAMKSSAAAMAVQTPSSSASGQQGDAVFGVLNTLPVKRGHEERRQLDEVTKILTSINSIFKRGDEERRQLDEVTKILTSINSIFKRDELEERQLGLVKSVPEAVGQAAQVEKLLTSLPIKRDGSDNLKDLGGLGGVLLKRDTERAESHDETYTGKALKGFQGWLHHGSQKDKQETPEIPSAADSIGLGDVAKPSSATLAKRDAEESESHDATYTEKALKGFQGWLHHGSKDHKQETPEKPSAVDSLGLTDVIKRSTPTDPISSLLSGIIGKREIGDSLATSEDVADALDRLAKRSGLDSVDQLIKGLTKGGQLNNGLSLRQLDVVSNLATGALSNAGSATGQLGKIAAGKFRRGNVEAGSIADAATAGLNIGNHNHKASKEGNSSAVDGVAEEVAEGEQALHDATASSDEHLDKRQVPPIAGSDALSIVKGLVANPNAALNPVTKGVLIGGTPLGDLAPK